MKDTKERYVKELPSVLAQVNHFEHDDYEQIIASNTMTQHDHIELQGKQNTDESSTTTVIIHLSDEPLRKRPRIAGNKSSEKH